MSFKVIGFFVLFASCYGAVDFGKYFKICERHSPDVNDCLVEAITNGIETMSNGVEELGIEAIDPYFQKELKIEYTNNQIKAKIVIKNISVIGLKSATVRDARLKANDDKFHMEVDMFSPFVNVKGQYTGEGGYNALIINASGEFTVNMTDLVYTWKLDGKPETIDGKTFVRISSFYMRPDVGNMKTWLTNDNPETAELTSLGIRLTNENWRTFYKELLPHAQSNWNKIGIRVSNQIFLKVPYDELFPNKS